MERKLLVFIFLLALNGVYAQENCSNGIDDNGNGLIDCNDPECQFAAIFEKGCNCDDGIDNDSDGQIDIYDPDCASYYGLTFVGDGTGDCSIPPPDSLDFFQFIDTPGQTQQNTVDTQSKMAIGDLDGDGIPEVIATSKWNKEIRVISSGGDGIHPAGDIIDQFGTTGGDDIFPPGNYVYELELAIADIDGDGDGEIFAIASRRQTPNSEPNGYFMVALTYENGVLTPMYDAVYIDPERPGMIAIADFDGDGLSEIYFKDRIYAAETGALLAQGTGDWNTEVNSAPVAVNVLPGTPNLELVCGNIIYNVPDLSNRNPATPVNLTVAKDLNGLGAQFYPKVLFDAQEYGVTNYSSTSVADVNGDGNIDVVLSGAVGSSNGNTAIFFWDVANDTYSVYEPPDPTYPGGWPWGTSRPNLGDANGDGQLDILFIAGNQLFALTLDAGDNLVPLWATPRIINDSRSGIVAVTIYDFENDGHPEVVYRDSQQLVIVDGDTGQDVFWSTVCQSHTMTEGPIIADVDGNGSTDITIPCYYSKNSFNINAQIQQQALGVLRIYYSAENLWLPTRKVWNQSGYFVVNVNDDLTIPRHQMDQSIIFGDDPCLNGTPGPIRPFNIFLNQAPSIGPDGCPFYPAPDISFVGDNPNAQPGDPDYKDPNDPSYFPAVHVIPPICGDLGIEVEFNIINDGSLTISSSIPVSFWDGDPTIDPPPANPATLLYTTNLQLNDFQVGDTMQINGVTFNSTGKAFRLFIVLNDDGSSLPVDPGGSGLAECRIENNVYYYDIIPDPFEVDIAKVQDNIKCEDSAPDNGELRAVITRNGVVVNDYSDFAFQWYDGIGIANPIPTPGGTTNVLTGLAEGDYSLVVTNTDKGCASIPTDTSIVRIGVDPEITIVENSPQSHCDPPNGELEVFITGGNAGYTFEWFDRLLNPLGITGSVASNLVAGEYIVSVFKDGCTKTGSYTLSGPVFPIVNASVLQDVVDCANLNSGVITAEASINGIPQDSSDYTFRWYEWDSVALDIGSILPPIHGLGPTRSGLLPGEYAVIARDENTGCETSPPVMVTVQDLTVIPTIVVSEVEPQTSCDPATPNGVLRADGYVAGVLQDPSQLTFEWFDGDNTLPANLITTVSGINGEIAEGIANSGLPYTVRVTTAFNCSSTLAYSDLTENLEIPQLSAITFDNSICDPALALGGVFNGRVETTASLSGVPLSDFSDYTFTWYDGDDITSDPVLTNTSADGDILYGLDAGRYTVTLERNSTACISDPLIVEIFDVTVSPVVNVTEIPATNCIGGMPNGQLTAEVDESGSFTINGYSFSWFEGVDTSPSGTPVSNVSGTRNETAVQLTGNNTYTVLIINDTSGCSTTESYIVTDDSQIPIVDLTKTDNTICDISLPTVNAYDGSATAGVTDRGAFVSNFSNYTFEWFDGPGTSDPVLTNTIADGDVLVEIPGGYYTVRVTNDSLGCISDPLSIEVMDVLDLPVISLVETPATNCDPAFANGEVAASVGGITSGFLFKWVAGNDVSVPEWSPVAGSASEIARMLLAENTYTVQVTNENTGCADTEGIVISDSSTLPLVALSQIPNSICDPVVSGNPFNGQVNGSTTYNGVPVIDFSIYSFNLFEGNDTTGVVINTRTGGPADFSALENGFYTVRAYNNLLGCYSDPVSIEVLEIFDYPVIDIAEVAATNCDPLLANGELSASVQGTTLGYSFKWVAGIDTNDPALDIQPGITGLSAGSTYTVKVTTDSTGCFEEESRILSDSSTLPEITLNQTPNSICDTLVAGVPYNGTINGATLYNGAAVSDYSDYYFGLFEGNDTTGMLNNSVTGSALNFIELENGFYTARAYNTTLGCYSDPVTIEVLENFNFPVINLTETAATNCDPSLANGQVTADVGGSVAGYLFKWVAGNDVSSAGWSPVTGGSGETALELLAGDLYTVRVTSENTGCANTEGIVISDSSEIPLVSLVQTPNTVCDPLVAGVPYDGTITGTTSYQGLPVGDYSDYYFNLFEGNDTTGVLNNTIVGSAINFTELQDGIYTARAYNSALGCYGDPETIEVLENFVLPVIGLTEKGATNCDPSIPNGSLTASDAGVIAGRTFKWVAGLDLSVPSWSTVSGTENETAEELISGNTYTVQVTIDATGCFEISARMLSDSSEVPILSLSQTPNTICDDAIAGAFDGTITGSMTYYGNPVVDFTPFDFNLFEGSDTTGVNLGTINGAIPEFIELQEGDYTARAYDFATGCYSSPATIAVQDNTVLPTILITKEPNSSCDDARPNGNIQAYVDVIGNTADHDFTWYDGGIVTPGNETATTGAVGEIISLMGNQNYTVEVVSQITGCVNTLSTFLNHIIPSYDLSIAVTDIVDCNTPGSILAEVDSSGTGPVVDYTNYVFYWYRGDVVDPGNELIETSRNLTEISPGVNLYSEDYSVYALNTYTHCISNDVTGFVAAPAALFDIQSEINFYPSDCETDEGALTTWVDNGGARDYTNYNFYWYEGRNINPGSNFYTDPPVAFVGDSLSTDFPDGSLTYIGFPEPNRNVQEGPTIYNLGDGAYSVLVEDRTTGCKEYLEIPLPSIITPPTLLGTVQGSALCPYDIGDGIVEAAIHPDSLISQNLFNSDYDFYLYEGISTDAGDLLTGPLLGEPDRVTFTQLSNLLAPGFYTVVANEKVSGSYCPSVPLTLEIEPLALPPVVSLNTALINNTSCDSTQINGQIELLVDKDPEDLTGPTTYSLTWTSTASTKPPDNSGVAAGVHGPYAGLNFGTYDVTVVDENSTCERTETYVLYNEPPEILVDETTLIVTDKYFCVPSGHIEITNIEVGGNPEPLSDFFFEWYDGIANLGTGTPIGPPAIIERLDSINYTTIHDGTYYVVVTKDPAAGGEGAGCESVPFAEEIVDRSIDPSVILTQSANLACDSSFATGTITLTANTGGSLASNYEFTLKSTALPDSINGFTGPGGSWTEIHLGPGQYNAWVRDVDNECTSTNILTINDNPAIPYIELPDLTILPQAICDYDGSVTVNAVRVNGVAEIPGINPGEVNYIFTWYESQPIPPDLGVLGNILDPSTYPLVEAGAYYFTALRNNNAHEPGEGCETAPFRLEIEDATVDPTINLTQTANRACDLSFATGSITLDVNTGGVVSSDYGYTITSTVLGGPLNGFTNDDGTPESWTELNLGPGQYNVEVVDVETFCINNRIITINNNPAVPYVEAADLTILPQTICANDGSITVNAIQINGVPETPGVVNYEFTWYEGQPNPPDLGITGNVLDTTNYPGIQAGMYYFTALRDNNANQPGEGCESAPFQAEIEDISVDPTLILAQMANRACDLSFATGSITLDVNTGGVVSSDYGYTITSTVLGGPLNGFTNDDGTPESWTELNLGPGQYNVQVTDVDNLCVINRTITINNNPAVPYVEAADLTILPQTICANDGSITVNAIQINGVPETPGTNPGEINYQFTWHEGQVSAPDLGVAGNVLDTTNYAGIGAGAYYFTALRDQNANQPGEGCETAPFAAEIEDVSVDPVLALTSTANQSCDTSVVANGTIQAVVTPSANSLGNFNYSWISFPTGRPQEFSGGTGSVNEQFPDLTYGQYNLEVEDADTRCITNRTVTINNNPLIPVISDYLVNDQTVCFNDGSIIVTSVTPGDTAEYDFTWFDGVNNFNGGVPIAGVTSAILDTTQYATIQAGNFYFTATKTDPTDSKGFACVSSPVKATIRDLSVDPFLALTPKANQNCDLSFANGTLTALATTNGIQGPSYSYTLTSTVLGAPVDSLNNDSQVVYDFLQPGKYNVLVVDDNTLCTFNRNATINDSPVYIDINDILYSVNDQAICAPDGSVVVTDITDQGVSQPLTDYNFTWYEGTINLNADIPLVATDSYLDTTNYVSIGAGVYFFTVTKATGSYAPGEGCESAPLRADILDTSTDPNLSFAQTYNTSCDILNPNGEISAVAVENDGTDTDVYSFAWNFNGSPLPPGVLQTDSANTSVLSDAPDGNYQLMVINTSRTSCQVTGGSQLKIDLHVSEPNIIVVDVIDPLNCNPTGQLEVTQIQVGGVPANVNDFEYKWYQGNFTPGDLILDSLGNPVTSSLLPNQYPEKYYVIAKNIGTACESNPKEADISNANIIYPAIYIDAISPQTSCDPVMPNAALMATVDGGNDDSNPNYQFEWYNSLDGTGSVIATSSSIYGLGADNFSVTVLDLITNCASTDYYITEDAIELYKPVISVAASPRDNCAMNNGSASAEVINAGGNFEFNWYIGDQPGTIPDYTGPSINGLPIGQYTVVATELDTTFCLSDPVTVVIHDERMKPVITVTEDNPLTDCWDDSPNGQFTATVNGVVGGYTFEWYNGSDTTGVADYLGSTYAGLSPLTYTVVVTDNRTQCDEVATRTITDNTVTPPVPDPEVVQHYLSCIEPDGWVRASVDGDVINYFFDWYDGNAVSGTPDHTGINYRDLVDGQYTVTAIDMVTGCVSQGVTVEVLDQRELPAFSYQVVPANCEQDNGSIELVWENDVPVSEIIWIDPVSGGQIDMGSAIYNYSAGLYGVIVTSVYGCETEDEVEIPIDIFEFNGISANGDGRNDYFEIACITQFPNNNVKIFNRAGQLVFEASHYDNISTVFKGIGQNGVYLMGKELPDGTYFYIIDKGDGSEPIPGYLELIR